MLQVKLGHFDQLPHKLMGICHDDTQKAQMLASECLMLWERQQGMHEHQVHPLLVFTFHEPLRLAALKRVALGETLLHEEPQLEHLLRLRFICLLELSVEGRHALVKKRVRGGRRVSSPSMVNYELQINEIKAWLKMSKGNSEILANHFDGMRSLKTLVGDFGLEDHAFAHGLDC